MAYQIKIDPTIKVISDALREASPFADDDHDYIAEAHAVADGISKHGGKIVWAEQEQDQ